MCFHPIDQVRLKMMYSATKATIKKSFDSAAIVDEISATSKVNKEKHLAYLV